jgi:predicted O-linked N-acetylglucosamine transferase (SPINDLY family)
LQPRESIYHFMLGNALLSMRCCAEAAEAFRACAALQPSCSDMQINYAAALIETHRREEARVALERLRARGTELWQVHFNLGGIYREYGRIVEAVACYRRCLELAQDHAPARSNLLLIMNYGAQYSAATIFQEHQRFGENFARRYVMPQADLAWPRRLKIGYVSPDLRGHVVSYFLEPLLANHDHAAFEVFCYHTHAEKDGITERLRGHADHWRDCEELSDAELAARVREDRIDILVDLAGHTADNRLLAFALKPAPVQATYLGYPSATGLAAMDYHITDGWADPPGAADALTVERKARLPGSYFCYRPARLTPEPGPSPARGAGTVTFGCFNNFPKVSTAFVGAAARVLAAVPGSRLVMKARALSVALVADGLRAAFAARGVDPARLDMRGWEVGYRDHLRIYHDVDIALDTYPYNGATTTCEALWMGVPVVTLACDRHAGRMGASLLHAVGLPELVARDEDEYVQKCAALARDPARLSALRGGLRARMQRSALMDEAGFARRFEDLCREMWREALHPRAAAAAQVPAEALMERARRAAAVGRLAEADESVRAVLAARPVDVEALTLLCRISFEAGSPGAAIEPLQRAIAADGAVAALHYMLGAVFQEQGKLQDAVASLERALALDPGLAKAHNNLGCILEGTGRLQEAIACFREASRLDPSLAQAHYNFGNACKQAGNMAQAVRSFERALALEPAQAEWRCNFASLQYDQWQLDEAIANLRGAIATDPSYARAHIGLGAALLMAGQVEEALGAFRTAQSLKPDPQTETWILFARHYLEAEEPQALYESHLDWAARHAAALPRMTEHAARRSRPRRRLNVGYVSPDFRRHPVAHFIAPVLASHDREAFRVFCYSAGARDETTVRLRAMCDFWRDISVIPDDVVADRVRADGIDILVDLAGHTAGGRLLLFARRPAPIQVTWIGYPNTTGLATMDYRLTDAVADPLGRTGHLHTEKLVRLETGFLCYAPPEEAPGVVEPPALGCGGITFGCFSTLPKVTRRMVAIWSDLLHALPGSRLVLKSYGLAARSAQAELRAQFAARSLDERRVELHGPEELFARHLSRYQEIDIALDTYPYNGTTTTCEALWMGVPVVTLAGEPHRSRVGASIAAAAGLPQLVAETPEQYLAAALALARDLQGLRSLRLGMRERLRSSSLLDAARFTRALEAGYRRMVETDAPAEPRPPADRHDN